MTTADINLIYGFKNYAAKICGDWHDAEDFIQTIFLRILINPEKFESLNAREKGSYILTAIHNQVKDRHKKFITKGRTHVPISESIAVPPEAYGKIEFKEVMTNGARHQHFNILLANVYGYNSNEISNKEKIPLNTVLGRYRYVRKFLKKCEPTK